VVGYSRRAQEVGRDFISAKDIADLKHLSQAANGWIAYSSTGPRFVPISEWKDQN
jgi:hypothetical protein